jgi:hypothetical protein
MRSDSDQRLINPTDGYFKNTAYAGEKMLYWGGKKPTRTAAAAAACRRRPGTSAHDRRDVDALIAFIDSRQRCRTPGAAKPTTASASRWPRSKRRPASRSRRADWSNRARGAARARKRFGSGSKRRSTPSFERIAAGPGDARRHCRRARPDFGIHPMIVEGATLVGPGDAATAAPARAMTCAWSAVRRRRKAAMSKVVGFIIGAALIVVGHR